jgi:hypothetical protein
VNKTVMDLEARLGNPFFVRMRDMMPKSAITGRVFQNFFARFKFFCIADLDHLKHELSVHHHGYLSDKRQRRRIYKQQKQSLEVMAEEFYQELTRIFVNPIMIETSRT